MAVKTTGYALPAANVNVLALPSVSLAGGTTIAVGNFPSTQPVSGTVSIGNLPAIQPITGTVNANINGTVPVSGTFWQATQPVSASSLPLPNGAATATGVAAVVTALGTPMQQTGGTVTANFGALNGAATAAGQNQISGQLPVSLGAKTAATSLSVVVGSDHTVPIVRRAVANIATGQQAVGQAATLVIPARTTRYNAVLIASGTGAYYVGTSTVSPTTGLYIGSGGYYTHEAKTPLYVYAASGTMTFTWLDEYD